MSSQVSAVRRLECPLTNHVVSSDTQPRRMQGFFPRLTPNSAFSPHPSESHSAALITGLTLPIVIILGLTMIHSWAVCSARRISCRNHGSQCFVRSAQHWPRATNRRVFSDAPTGYGGNRENKSPYIRYYRRFYRRHVGQPFRYYDAQLRHPIREMVHANPSNRRGPRLFAMEGEPGDKQHLESTWMPVAVYSRVRDPLSTVFGIGSP